jgi:hypothetical protein
MKYIKLFEYFLKSRTPDEILMWNKPINNPLKGGRFKDVILNRDGIKIMNYDGVPVIKREMYEFPNDDTLLDDVKYNKNISSKEIDLLLQYGFSHLPRRVELEKYTMVLIPQTGSIILDKMIDELYDVDVEFGSGGAIKEFRPRIIRNAFTKRTWNEVEWDMKKIDKLAEETKNDVLRTIERLKTNKGTEKVKLSSNVIPRYRKFIKRFLDIRPEVADMIRGKDIIIMDDFVTDGTTRKEMRNLAVPFSPRSILSLALFYLRGQKQESDPK